MIEPAPSRQPVTRVEPKNQTDDPLDPLGPLDMLVLFHTIDHAATDVNGTWRELVVAYRMLDIAVQRYPDLTWKAVSQAEIMRLIEKIGRLPWRELARNTIDLIIEVWSRDADRPVKQPRVADLAECLSVLDWPQAVNVFEKTQFICTAGHFFESLQLDRKDRILVLERGQVAEIKLRTMQVRREIETNDIHHVQIYAAEASPDRSMMEVYAIDQNQKMQRQWMSELAVSPRSLRCTMLRWIKDVRMHPTALATRRVVTLGLAKMGIHVSTQSTSETPNQSQEAPQPVRQRKRQKVEE